MESATGQFVAAEMILPPTRSVAGLRRVIIVDRIQDPGNLGTLLRTAAALGWEGAFLCEWPFLPMREHTVADQNRTELVCSLIITEQNSDQNRTELFLQLGKRSGRGVGFSLESLFERVTSLRSARA